MILPGKTNIRGYTTNSFSLMHENRCFRFSLPADQDAVINKITDENNDRIQPYWAENWPSTSSFFTYIMKQRIPAEWCIGELGCGLGVLSACLSSKHLFTIATDISWDGCCFASHNITRNDGIARVVCADWSDPPFKNVFDLIVASDILYEERLGSIILDCCRSLLVPGGIVWIADPRRKYWEGFKQKALQNGFILSIINTLTMTDSEPAIEIIELRKTLN